VTEVYGTECVDGCVCVVVVVIGSGGSSCVNDCGRFPSVLFARFYPTHHRWIRSSVVGTNIVVVVVIIKHNKGPVQQKNRRTLPPFILGPKRRIPRNRKGEIPIHLLQQYYIGL